MLVIIKLEELESLYKKSRNFRSLKNKLSTYGYTSEEERESDHVEMFYSIYRAFRRKFYIKSMGKIEKGHKAWGILTAIADEAWVFCKDHNFPDTRSGFVKFMEVAGEKGWVGLKSLSQNKFKVSEIYGMEKALLENPLPELSESIYRSYVEKMGLWFGVFDDFSTPEFYINFVNAAKVAKEFNLQGHEYVDKVFNVWEWTGNPITGPQLWQDKTKEFLVAGGESTRSKVKIKKVKIRKGAERWE